MLAQNVISSHACSSSLRAGLQHGTSDEGSDEELRWHVELQPRLRIAYIVDAYPVASERFVSREVAMLEALGVDLAIVSIGPGSRCSRAAACRPAWTSPALWRHVIATWFSNPGRVARLARHCVEAFESPLEKLLGLRWLAVTLYLAKKLDRRRSGIDLLHANFASLPSLVAGLLALDWSLPWGCGVHARDFYSPAVSTEHVLRSASYILACSRALADDVRATLSTNRVHVMHHGLADAPACADRLPRVTQPLFLAAGRFEPKKGFLHLLAACALLRDKGFDFRCKLIGQGRQLSILERRISELQLGSRVEVLPWLSPDDLSLQYAQATAMVIPSVIATDGDRDNIPNVLVEALFHELPVIASALPSLVALLQRREAALLVRPADPDALAAAMELVATCASTTERLRHKGRRLATETFNLRENITRMTTLMQASVAEARAGRDRSLS